MSADREALLRKYRAFMLQQRAEAEDGLKHYCNKIRGALADETLLDWCEVHNMELVETAVQDTLNWLEYQTAEKSEIEAKMMALKGL
eukprot:12096441-Alexandrium_andersonii.AAC.1